MKYSIPGAVAPDGHEVINSLIAGLTNLDIDLDREDDGRFIAEIESLPGCLVYGQSREDAIRKVHALALRVVADKIEHGELIADGTMAGH